MNYKSYQILLREPVASHGLASELKAARFVVDMPATVAGDTFEFGTLPQFAVPVDALIFTTGTFTGDVSIGGEVLFSTVTASANTVRPAALAPVIGLNVGDTPISVTGRATASGAAGKFNLIVVYAIGGDGLATFERFIPRDEGDMTPMFQRLNFFQTPFFGVAA